MRSWKLFVVAASRVGFVVVVVVVVVAVVEVTGKSLIASVVEAETMVVERVGKQPEAAAATLAVEHATPFAGPQGKKVLRGPTRVALRSGLRAPAVCSAVGGGLRWRGRKCNFSYD